MHPIYNILPKAPFTENDLVFLSESPYYLKVRVESENNSNLVTIDYDQIESPRFHPIVDECRGIVVCMDTGKIVCWPYKRFYNYEEGNDKNIFDWNSAIVQSKEDGSLIKVYYHNNRWHIGTRGTAFGNNKITSLTGEEGSISFRDLFLKTIGLGDNEFQTVMNSYNKDYNFFFELCTLETKVVTKYIEPTVFLHGIRSNSLFVQPVTEYIISGFRYKLNTFYNFSNFEQTLESLSKLENLQEGYVLCDKNGIRIKMKSLQYVTAHHIRGEGLTPKRAIRLILANEHHEFISYFPEYSEFINKFHNQYENVIKDINNTWENVKSIENQKDFAMKVKDLPYFGILFSLKKFPNKSVHDIIHSMSENSQLNLFGIK